MSKPFEAIAILLHFLPRRRLFLTHHWWTRRAGLQSTSSPRRLGATTHGIPRVMDPSLRRGDGRKDATPEQLNTGVASPATHR